MAEAFDRFGGRGYWFCDGGNLSAVDAPANNIGAHAPLDHCFMRFQPRLILHLHF